MSTPAAVTADATHSPPSLADDASAPVVVRDLCTRELTTQEAQAPRWWDTMLEVRGRAEIVRMAERVREKNLVPVIVDRVRGGRVDLSRHAFKVLPTRRMAEFFELIRVAWNNTDPTKGISFMLRDPITGMGIQPVPSRTVAEYHAELKNELGIMLIEFCEQPTFG